MTSNIVTLIGRTPKAAQDEVREVPAFKPRLGPTTDPEERASLYALANADETMRLAMLVATAEGAQAALDMLDNAKSAVTRQFNLFGNEKQSARIAFLHAFRRYAACCGGNTLEALEQAGDFKVKIDKERASIK
jgi:hypothetical protein